MPAHVNRPLSVLVDVSALAYGRGVSRYTSNLVRALLQEPELRVGAFAASRGHQGDLRQWMSELPALGLRRLWPIPTELLGELWHRHLAPAPWIGTDAQVYHAWDWQLAPTGSRPQVVTIHDLAYKLFPHTVHPRIQHRYDRLLAQLERSPEIQIIAVSQTTKRDIARLTTIDESRIHVVYEALPSESALSLPADEAALLRRELGLERPFVLTVGTAEPRKNLLRTVEAWRPLREDLDLVVVGAAGWEALPREPGIHVVGYVDNRTLAALYREAHALLFASLYEGFGLPILEAYYHGCPVITSNRAAMVEVGGAPALYVDPEDVAAITQAVRALEGKQTQARRTRQKDMREVLASFSWQRAARETAAVYDKARR